MAVIIFSLFVSLLLLAINIAVSSRLGARGIAGVSVLTTVVFFCLMTPVMFLQSLLTLIVAGVCGGLRLGPKALTRGCVAAVVVSYLLFLPSFVGERNRLAALRVKYPVESLAHRLAYEVPRSSLAQRAEGTTSVRPLPESLEKELQGFEGQMNGHWRSIALQRLHTQTVDEFVVAQGFGAGRMARVGSAGIELPNAEPISLSSKPVYSPDVPSPLPLAHDDAEPPVPTKEWLSMVHATGIQDFLDPRRMGYVEDMNHVTGFLPHQFARMPDSDLAVAPKTQWQIMQLELLSLLKHEVPVAYLSKHLPRMDELREAPTRPLKSFERDALPQLRSEKDLVIEEKPERIRMLGSLRANKDCLECHSVRRGDLLGAFSYELVPKAAKPSDKAEEQVKPEPLL